MPILCSASPHLHPLNKSLSLKEKDHNEQEAYKNSKEEREKRRNEMRWEKQREKRETSWFVPDLWYRQRERGNESSSSLSPI